MCIVKRGTHYMEGNKFGDRRRILLILSELNPLSVSVALI